MSTSDSVLNAIEGTYKLGHAGATVRKCTTTMSAIFVGTTLKKRT